MWTDENLSSKKKFSAERYRELNNEDYVGHFAYLEGQVLLFPPLPLFYPSHSILLSCSF